VAVVSSDCTRSTPDSDAHQFRFQSILLIAMNKNILDQRLPSTPGSQLGVFGCGTAKTGMSPDVLSPLILRDN
jgi:hypothetical protein